MKTFNFVLISIFVAGAIMAAAIPAATASAGQQFDQKDMAVIQKYRLAAPDLEKGQEYLVKGKLKQAEKKLRQVLETLPEHATAAYFLADCYSKQGRIEEGLTAIVKAEANFADFNRIIFRWQLAQVNSFEGQKIQLNAQLNALQIKLAEAKTDAERAPIQSQILSVQASQNAGYQRMDEERISEEYAVQADYYYLHGNLLFKKKACQGALDQYLKAVEIDPKHGNSYNNIANLYYLGKQYDKAEEYLDKAEANGAKVNPAFKQALAKALNK
jgi:tetratricopeptide (TPR) repeat protein